MEDKKNNQDSDYKWFIENQKKLHMEFPDEFLAISDKQILCNYSTFDEALQETLKKKEAGDFIIQQALETSDPIQYYNYDTYA